MKIFSLVLARDEKHVAQKIDELKEIGVPYLVICGKQLDVPNVIYREPRGKYDAINFGFGFVPRDVDVVVLNDVDASIRNFHAALRILETSKVSLVFARVIVNEGPQRSFYGMLDFIRKRAPIAASGELMLVRRGMLEHILPIKPCKAEDSYILFKVLEFKGKVSFCEDCYVITERTKSAEKEEDYKRKTVCGLYQALGYADPSVIIKVFYVLLPFFSPMLVISGRRGYFWMKGILLGFTDYLRGDRSGTWQQTYME